MNKAPDFSEFHDAYGRAYGRKLDRLAAERAWRRLSARDKRAAIAGIQTYADDCRQRGIAMKYPSGYLTLHRWEIEEVGSGTEKELSQTSKPKFNASMLGQMNVRGKADGLTISAIIVQEPTDADPAAPLEGMDTW